MANDFRINITIGGLKLMVDLKLENDERIICRVRGAGISDGKTNDTLEGLFLTDRHLISVYEKPFALFSKEKMIIDKKPLKLISSCNDEIQVATVKDDEFEVALHIFYDNGMDYLYSLGEDVPKSMYLQWEDAIKKAVIENRKNITLKEENENENVESTFSAIITEETNEKNEPSKALNVIFCTKCGAKNNFEAKFCQSCGFPMQVINNPQGVEKMPNVPQEAKKAFDMTQNRETTSSDRKQEFVGKILKCPSCGAQLSSFTAICPDCGYEINSQKISSSIKEFMDAINEYDRIIANNLEPPKTGWKTWNKWVKVGWIILNIITSCIPLVIYLAFPLIKPFILPRNIPQLSPDEKRKVTLIENYVFPNEREAVVEAMMFAQSKMAFLVSEKYNRKTLYWFNLWNTKAEQLKQRADIILKRDKIVEETYKEITTNRNKINKYVKVRAIIGTMIIVFWGLFVLIKRPVIGGIIRSFSHSSNMSQISKEDEKDTKESVKWSDMFLSVYFPEPVLSNAYVYSNSKEECNIGQIDCSQSEYYAYCRQCKEWGFDYEIMEEDETWFTAYNSEGYKVHISYIDSDLSIELNAPMKMSDFNWPESEIGQIVPVPQSTYGKISWEYDSGFLIYIGNMSHEDFNEYANLLYKSGFNINDRKDDCHFWADNADGYHISIEYEGFNIVWLRADAPDDK